jgi:hypothetical protein
MSAVNLETHTTGAVVVDAPTYCPQHPTVETQMRCNRCGKFICLKCAARTPVGYRCKECVYQQQNVYFNAKPYDDAIVFLVTLSVALVVTPMVALVADSFYFGAFYLAFFAGPAAGALLAQLVRTAVGRRRSRYAHYCLLAGLLTGVLCGVLGSLVVADLLVLTNLPMWIFVGMAATTGYKMLR